MRRPMLALLAAGAAALVLGESLPSEARPLGGGWGAGRAGISRGVARIRGAHSFHSRIHRYGDRHRFGRRPLVRATITYSGARYLSDEAGFLWDAAVYATDSYAYPVFWSGGHPDRHGPVGTSYALRTSYAVPVHDRPHARRVVTVHRGTPAPDGVAVQRVRYAR